jgi:hypothetical protein
MIASAVARGSAGSGRARRPVAGALPADSGVGVGCGKGVGVEDVGESDMSVSGGVGLVVAFVGCTGVRGISTFAGISECFLRTPKGNVTISKPGLQVEPAPVVAEWPDDRGSVSNHLVMWNL